MEKPNNYRSLKMNRKRILIFIFLGLAFLQTSVFAQDNVEGSLLSFTRGKLWHSLYYGKSGPASFDNWRRIGIGLDWPGFDDTKIKEDIGGAATYLSSGGLYVGCRRMDDTVLAFEDWAMYAPGISQEFTAKYIVRTHKKYTDNHGLQKSSSRGEEVIETVWEYNPNFPNTYEPERQIPVRVKRTAHQWNGSMSDENYIIYEYVITNIANELTQFKKARKIVDSLKDFYVMFDYALQANTRSWRVLFPTEEAGARNTRYNIDTTLDFYGDKRQMIYGWAGKYRNPKTGDTMMVDFGRCEFLGQKRLDVASKEEKIGEWLAPGYVGFRLLYSTPDKIRNKSGQMSGYGWSAAENNLDLAGPITGKTGLYNESYGVLADPSKAYNYVKDVKNPLMGARRLWSMMSLGPWDLLPGDSIVIAVAEIVDGIDYSKATGPGIANLNNPENIEKLSSKIFFNSADKAKFTYENKFNHPDPPVAPAIKVDYYRERSKFVANEISWPDSCEDIPDPDDGMLDLKGYRLYRSNYLTIGPWTKIADITKGDSKYYSNGKYTFIDSTVDIGSVYYYALTAYDISRSSWNVNPSAKFVESRSTRVPSLESSIYANRTERPFLATLPSMNNLDEVLVVPNPFIIGEGSSQPGSKDDIQFVNIPNPCTIKIFSVSGTLIKTINVPDGSGAIASWSQTTDYGQYVQPGMYIFYIDSPKGVKAGKFAIIR